MTIIIYSVLLLISLITSYFIYLNWKLRLERDEVERLEELLENVSNDLRKGRLIRKYSDDEIERLR